MHFGIYFTNHNNQTIELPIAPSELKDTLELDYATSTVSKLGDIIRPGMTKLKELEFTVEIPKEIRNCYYVTAKNPFIYGEEYLNWLQEWLNSKKAGRVVISGTTINLPVMLVKAESALAGGNLSSWFLTIRVLEYREYRESKLNPLVKISPPTQSWNDSLGSLDELRVENGKLRARGWHYGNGKDMYVFLMDAETNREIARRKASAISRPDVGKHHGANAVNSGFDVFFDIPKGKNVYIQTRRTNNVDGDDNGQTDKVYGSQIVVFSNKVAKTGQHRAAPNQGIVVGSRVIVNGRLHQDSSGNGAGEMEHNAERKIGIVSQGAKYPYHVTMLDGSWRGWVEKGAIKLK